MDLSIRGKVAVIGGASQGIGRACAFGLAQEGVNLAICARTRDAVEETARSIRQASGVDVLPLAGDLSQYETIQRLVKEAVGRFGRLDILVGNVGGPPAGRAETTGEEAWSLAVNQTLLFFVRMAREALPHMRRQGWGRIINILSISVKQPIDNLVLSNSARMGVVGFMKTLSDEVAPYNVTVNNVLPGSILTNRMRQLATVWGREQGKTPEQVLAERARGIPMGRVGTPEELANLVVFLASEKASYITGASIQVDGGALRNMF
ncbi:MAG: SDR family oxidoreductase [Chloroflexi bacterium]|nr:SDR family oxidoreductase [Chloroflexota bacterium]